MNRDIAVVQVVAVEDDARYRAGLEALLEHADDFRLTRCFAAPADVLAAARAALDAGAPPAWDLVLMDMGLPGLSGIECTRRLKALVPEARIIALTVFEDRATILAAICAGADGYLLKRTPADSLLEQLRTVIAGGSPLSGAVARTVLDVVRLGEGGQLGSARPGRAAATRLQLTEREHEVLSSLVEGRSYKATARELEISIDTVRSHIRSVYAKLQVHSVAEAVGRALRDGIV